MAMFFGNNYNGIASYAVSTSRQRQPFQKSLCLDGHFKPGIFSILPFSICLVLQFFRLFLKCPSKAKNNFTKGCLWWLVLLLYTYSKKKHGHVTKSVF